MKQILTTLLLLAVLAFALPVGDPRTPLSPEEAQRSIPVEQGKRELSLHVFGGLSRIDYPDAPGSTSFSPGFGAAFSYNHFFTGRWSFLVGAGIQLFNNRGTVTDEDFTGVLRNQNDYTDPTGENKGHQVDVYYAVEGYDETQYSLMFMVPAMFQYQSNERAHRSLYLAMGAKLGIPFAGNYEGKAARLRTCGYYPEWQGADPGSFDACNGGGYFGEGSEDLGFGEYGAKKSVSRLKFTTAIFAAFEAGVKWRLWGKQSVYTGFWLDWGLNDIAVTALSGDAITWQPTEGVSDGVTPQADVKYQSRTVGKALPMSAGLAVRFSLGGGALHEIDTMVFVHKIRVRDTIIRRNDTLIKDQQDTIDQLRGLNRALFDSLMACRGNNESLAAMQARMAAEAAALLAKRRADSLAALARAEA
jgi:hypothetical protein